MQWLRFRSSEAKLLAQVVPEKYLFVTLGEVEAQESRLVSSLRSAGFVPVEGLRIFKRRMIGLSILALSEQLKDFVDITNVDLNQFTVSNFEAKLNSSKGLHNGSFSTLTNRVRDSDQREKLVSQRTNSHESLPNDSWEGGGGNSFSPTRKTNITFRPASLSKNSSERGQIAHPRTLDLFGDEQHTESVSNQSGGIGNGNTGSPSDVIQSSSGHNKKSVFTPSARGETDRPTTKKSRLEANLSAIRFLCANKVKPEAATEANRIMLSKYSGWGGLINELSDPMVEQEVVALLGRDAFATIRESALTAYFTPASVSASIWDLLREAGWSGGTWLESSAGTGEFIAQRNIEHDSMQHCTAVEMEPISANILRFLYPNSTIIESAFERVPLLGEQFDLALSNYPFGEIAVFDGISGDSLSIHNYFLRQNIRLLKEGGIAIAITSQWTMDSEDASFREEIYESSDLIAALRLPSGVFADSGTSVGTDLLFFRKRFSGEPRAGIPFIHKEERSFRASEKFSMLSGRKTLSFDIGEEISVSINECYSNGGMLVGDPSVIGDQYNTRAVLKLRAGVDEVCRTIRSQAQSLKQRGAAFPKPQQPPRHPLLEEKFASKQRPVSGSYLEVNGTVRCIDLVAIEPDGSFSYTASDVGLKGSQHGIAIAAMKIKSAVKVLLAAESDDADSGVIEKNRSTLNWLYDAFVQKYGFLNAQAVRRVMRLDAESPLLFGLENWLAKEKIAKKSDIFSTRVISPRKLVESADNLAQAVAISLSKSGSVDDQIISGLLGGNFKALVREDDSKTILFDPVTKRWEIRAVVLTGNVRTRLMEFERAAKALTGDDSEYAAMTINALNSVMPVQVPPSEVCVDLGSRWLPDECYVEFINYCFGLHGVSLRKVEFDWPEGAAKPTINFWPESYTSSFSNTKSNIFGTAKMPFESLLMHAAAGKRPSIYVEINGSRFLDSESTMRALAKTEEIEEHFQSWLSTDPARLKKIADIYNGRFNNYHYEDISLQEYHFEGMSPLWKPRPHQTTFALRALLCGNSLAAHCVGAGKMMEKIMIASEAKRLGFSRKPTLAVPNHMLGDFAEKASSIFPAAKICLISQRDLQKERRRQLMSRVAMNDWDMVIITHSVLDKISVPIEFENAQIQSDLDALMQSMSNAKKNGRSISQRDMAMREKTLKTRLRALQEKSHSASDLLDMAQLGIDMLLVDEAHTYKNLSVDTTSNDYGVNRNGSAIADQLFMKSLYLERIRGREDGLHFFTGTPITNSIAELYTLGRYLSRERYRECGINNFDEWVAVFGRVTTELEILPEGGGYHLKSRLNEFKNVPELLVGFRSFADIKTREDLNLPAPRFSEENIVAKATPEQKLYMSYLGDRAKLIRNKASELFFKDDILLSVVTAGRQSALDMRIIEPRLEGDPSTKVSLCAKKMLDIYRQFDGDRACQMMFCDANTPSGKRGFNVYAELKRLLIAGGVPEAEIAFAQDCRTDQDKENLQAKANSGEVRFFFASTVTGGTGTNVQERLVAIHNLDAPWRPSDIEQRLGRAVRQGNLFEHVFVVNYTTEDSFDLFMWDSIRRKAKYISQIMRDPKSAARRLVEGNDIDPAAVISISTGSTLIRDKTEVDAKILKLTRREAMFHATRQASHKSWENAKKNLPLAMVDLGILQSAIAPMAAAIRARMESGHETAFMISGAVDRAQDGSTTWLYNKDAASTFYKRCRLGEIGKAVVVGELLGRSVYLRKAEWSGLGEADWDVGGEAYGDTVWRHGALTSQHNYRRLMDVIYGDLLAKIEQKKRLVQDYEQAISIGAPKAETFKYADELSALKAQKEELDVKLAGEMKAAGNEKIVVGETGWELFLKHRFAQESAVFEVCEIENKVFAPISS